MSEIVAYLLGWWCLVLLTIAILVASWRKERWWDAP